MPARRKDEEDLDEREEVEEEEVPRSKKKARPRDEDEDEDERPTKKTGKKGGSNEDMVSELPEDEAEEVLSQVKGKERLLWVGKPSVKLMVMRSLPIALGSIVFLIAAVIIFFSMKDDPNAGAIKILVPALLVSLGGGLTTAPIWAKKRAGRSFYALTNKRALVWKGGLLWGHSFEEFTAMQLGNMKRQNSWVVSGAGDLVFKEETKITQTHYAGGYRGGYRSRGRVHGRTYVPGHTETSVQIIQHGFMALEDVAAVEKIIKREIIEKINRALEAQEEDDE
jgi:hypothetical protein